jgi:hypothetical protein
MGAGRIAGGRDRGNAGGTMSSQPDQVVRPESLTKRFGEITAVDDLSFTLERGTITARRP